MSRIKAKPNRFNFTKKLIDQLESSKVSNFIYDTDTKGLCLRVGKAGSKTFYHIKWNAEKHYSDRVVLGYFPEMTIDQARRLVREESIIRSKNDVYQTSGTRFDLTVGELFTLYKAQHELEQRTFKSHVEKHYFSYFQRWYDRRIESISKLDVQAWVNDIGKNHGKRTANHCHAILRAMINWGVNSENLARIVNPCQGVQKFSIPKRLRFLQPGDEFNAFMKALDTSKHQGSADLYRMCLWTGARIGNVRKMRWQDVTLVSKLWTIPSEFHKNKTMHTVTLTREALEVLKRRSKNKHASGYVFANNLGQLPHPSITWKTLMRRSGIKGLTPHDLRHTLASYMAMSGASLPTIGAALGHKSVKATEIYAHLLKQPVKIAMQKGIDSMFDPTLIMGNEEDE